MGDEPASHDELQRFLTPELLSFIVRARLPYGPNDAIDFSRVGREIFLEDKAGPLVREAALPALSALSKAPATDLTRYLPPPADRTYPEQCLGLQLLLDQCPRLLLRGVDTRWTVGPLAAASQRLARAWLALPPEQRPDAWVRWRDDAGASLGYWSSLRFWFGAPLVHAQDRALQRAAVDFTDETRRVVEAETGRADPYRAGRDDLLADVYAFPREFRKGPPQGEGVTCESWTFWMCMLMDVHKPIIDRFGRYPYLNAILGRQSSAEEEDWIAKTDHFGEADSETADKIKEDVKMGRMRPLGEDSL